MNAFCVLDRKYDAAKKGPRRIEWPSDLPGEERDVFHRGGRLSIQHIQWWQEACRKLALFRTPSAVAVSKQYYVAWTFMMQHGYPHTGVDNVYFRFHLVRDGTP